MKNKYLILGLSFALQVCGITLPQAQTTEFSWASASSMSGSQAEATAKASAIDKNGNIYATGHVDGTATFGGSSVTSVGTDMLLVAYNSNGSTRWAISDGGLNNQVGHDIAVDDKGDVYVVGQLAGTTATFENTTRTNNGGIDLFVAKYSKSGKLQWMRNVGGPNGDYAYSVAADALGNVYVTGSFTGVVNFSGTILASAGGQDVFIAKYDTNGILVWVRSAGSGAVDQGFGIDVDFAGNVYVTGQYGGPATFGTSILLFNGGDDVFVAKYNSQGAVQWVQGAGGQNQDIGYGVAVDRLGNVYATGSFNSNVIFGNVAFNGNFDGFLVKYSSTGVQQWARNVGGSGSDYCHSLTVDAAGSAYITGSFRGTASFGNFTMTSSGGDDAFIAKYDPSGAVASIRKAGGNGDDVCHGVAVDRNGNAYMAGTFRGTATFDAFTLSSNSPAVFMAKYGSSSTTLTPLPVTLLYFQGKGGTEGSELSWATATELNSSHFVVERSTTGQDFTPLATVKATGNSTRTLRYSYLDQGARKLGGTHYYRLRQVDFDGKSSYSPVVAVSLSAAGELAPQLVAYPNPCVAGEALTLALPHGVAGQTAQVQLRSAQGQPLYQQKVQLEGLQVKLAELPRLAPGLYLLQVTLGATTTTTRLAMK